jgi:hypothetical protein
VVAADKAKGMIEPDEAAHEENGTKTPAKPSSR